MICIHHNDPDGYCSAAIVRRRFPDCKLVPYDYSSTLDLSWATHADGPIWVVDLSLPAGMLELFVQQVGFANVVWIDHHKTSIELTGSLQELPGARSMASAACVLVWRWIFGERPVPEAVALISDYDNWDHMLGERTNQFIVGLKIFDHRPESPLWNALLGENLEEAEMTVEGILEAGAFGLRFREQTCKDYLDQYGFECRFEGLRCFASGLLMFGSNAYGERFRQYDACISFEFSGDRWKFSLYSHENGPDVSAIAKKYGGGGHQHAAGFVWRQVASPFGSIIEPCGRNSAT